MAMAPTADLSIHSPPARIPKLKYRNPLPAPLDSAALHSLSPSQDTLPLPGILQNATRHLEKADSSERQPSLTTSLTSPSLASTNSSQSSNDSTGEKKKKKKSSVLGFLSLKEPSQLALEQFADQQRKQAATKGTSSPTSRNTNSFVGKQLPANVPKVNSKWDGIPGAVKQHNKRLSTFSTNSTSSSKDNRSNLSSRGSFGSQSSVAPWRDTKVLVVTEQTRTGSASSSSAAPSESSDTASERVSTPVTFAPEVAHRVPEGPFASGALPVEATKTESIDESKPASPPRSSVDSGCDFAADLRHEYRPASPASSTDSDDTIVRDTADNIFKKLNNQPQQNTLWDKSAPPVQPLDHDVPDSHDFLFGPSEVEEASKDDVTPPATPPVTPVAYYAPQRPVQNFSRPMSKNKTPPKTRPAAYKSPPLSPPLPTLYEASLASTDDLVGANGEEFNGEDTRSIAPSTIAPSELSQTWYESPRERLGLGGNLRVNGALPWEVPQGEAKPKKHRLSWLSGAARA